MLHGFSLCIVLREQALSHGPVKAAQSGSMKFGMQCGESCALHVQDSDDIRYMVGALKVLGVQLEERWEQVRHNLHISYQLKR